MKIRAKHSKIFLGIILSILFVLNFTITAAAGVNGAEELGTISVQSDITGSPVNGYYKTSGYRITWDGDITTDGSFRNCDNATNKYFYAAAGIDPNGGQHYYYLPTWPAVINEAWLGRITSGTLLYTQTGIKPSTVDYSYHVNNESDIPGFLAVAYNPPGESWTPTGPDLGTLSKVHFYIPVASTITYPSNGDDDAPSVLLSASPEGETFTDSNSKVWSKNARISVVATDTKAKPHATSPIRWSNSEGLIRDWGVGSNTSYTINNTIVSDYILSSTNSTYTVSVRDGLLNSTTRNVVVDYIDNVDPDVSKTTKTTNHPVSVEGAEYTKTSVTLAVSANDLGCGLSQNPYSWDGGNTWTNKATYTVNNNSSIRLLVRDGLNNTTERNFSVNNIDKISPVILSVNKNPKEWTSGFTTVSVEASDNVALAAYPYSWDGGNTWTNNQTKNIFVEGDYNLVVRDAVGNISTSLVTMKKTIITKPFVPDLPKPIPTNPINPINPPINPIVPMIPDLPKPVPEEPKDPKEDEKEEDEDSLSENDFSKIQTDSLTDQIQTISNEQNKNNVLLLILLFLLLFLLLLFLLLFLIFKTTKLYAILEEEEKYLGLVFIKKQKDFYQVTISDSLLEKEVTENYKLKFSRLFAKNKEQCTIQIILSAQTLQETIKEEVYFQYK